MKFQSILAVSAIALMMSGAAIAADNDGKIDIEANDTQMTRDLKQSINNTAEKMRADDSAEAETNVKGKIDIEANDSKLTRDVKQGLNKAGDKMRAAADEVKAYFIDADKDGVEPMSFNAEMTAEGMIGKKITKPTGENIAKVHDILLDANGNATKVIVSDGGLLGIGDKLAAFDFARVISKTDDGRIAMNLSQEMIDQAAKFSYDVKDADKATVLPAGAISAKSLLDGEVYDSAGKKVASVENISIVDGEATKLIAGYDKILGMGGDLAALDFDSVTFAKKKGETDVSLNSTMSAKFDAFRKTSK